MNDRSLKFSFLVIENQGIWHFCIKWETKITIAFMYFIPYFINIKHDAIINIEKIKHTIKCSSQFFPTLLLHHFIIGLLYIQRKER